MKSVLQDWVMELPLREQGTLLTAVRGCDLAPKYPLDSPERMLTGFIRWAFLNPADPREVDIPGAFFQSRRPTEFKASCLGHYPWHWISHVLHALEVIMWRHPDKRVSADAAFLYGAMVHSFHLKQEDFQTFEKRLQEDRIAAGTVVS